MSDTGSKCIPFVNTSTDASIASQFYKDCAFVRLSLQQFDNLAHHLPATCKRWIDGGTDGLGQPKLARTNFIDQFDNWKQMHDSAFQTKPDTEVVRQFAEAILDSCLKKGADWISIPQLPYTSDSKRNRINRLLASSSGTWRLQKGNSVRLILPVILTHKRQTDLKTARNQRVRLAAECHKRASADGYWVVDQSLSDVDGSPSFGERFEGLIHFQEELATKIGNQASLRVAGPYWGLGLVLWARGLVDYIGVGLGNAYQYHSPGGHSRQPHTRVSLPHLCRLAIVSGELHKWLHNVAAEVPDGPIKEDFESVAEQIHAYMTNETARRQIARFHRSWFDTIAKAPPPGRPLALYQYLSSAYVLGKGLHSLPANESVRRPESVARLLMLCCL